MVQSALIFKGHRATLSVQGVAAGDIPPLLWRVGERLMIFYIFLVREREEEEEN